MKLDLNTPLLNLEGTAIEDATIGKVLATQLSSASEGDAVKYMIWATLLYKGSPIEVDKADIAKIEKFVEGHRALTNLAKAAILNAINDQMAEQKPKA
jgi:hypothetical protein